MSNVLKNTQLAGYFISERYVKSKLFVRVDVTQDQKSTTVKVGEAIFRNFNEKKLKGNRLLLPNLEYLNDPVFASLLDTLFSRYGDLYKKQMHPKSRKKISHCIKVLVSSNNKSPSAMTHKN